MGFQLVQKLVTLNAVMALIMHYFTEFGSFRGQLYQSGWRQTYTVRDKNVVHRICFSDISFMAMFAEVTENEWIIERLLHDIDSFAILLSHRSVTAATETQQLWHKYSTQ